MTGTYVEWNVLFQHTHGGLRNQRKLQKICIWAIKRKASEIWKLNRDLLARWGLETNLKTSQKKKRLNYNVWVLDTHQCWSISLLTCRLWAWGTCHFVDGVLLPCSQLGRSWSRANVNVLVSTADNALGSEGIKIPSELGKMKWAWSTQRVGRKAIVGWHYFYTQNPWVACK